MRKSLAGLPIAAFLWATWPALAHDAFGNVAPFWSGALHILVSPLSMATLLATGAVLATIKYATAERCGLMVMASAGLVALTGDTLSAFAPVGAIAAGLIAATGFKPEGLPLQVLCILAGSSIAAAASVDKPDLLTSAGVILIVFAALLGALLVFEALEQKLPLARRVIGAWVAAIGLLLAALSLRT